MNYSETEIREILKEMIKVDRMITNILQEVNEELCLLKVKFDTLVHELEERKII